MTPSRDDATTAAHPAPTDSATVARPGAPAAPRANEVPEVPGYEILGELGRGGMGVVYRARQVSLNRVVALKMLPGASYAEPHERARFLAEAELVAAVRHGHVVQVFDFGQCAGRPYFAMEHLGGGSLVDLIRKRGRLAPRAAAELVEQIARGVAAAHDLGIVHRDIKPQNVLLDDEGAPKVTDFGLAKRGGRADLTQTGAVMGTPAYMAPEQASGRTKFVGPAADIYALGAILYECLTGHTPFTADDTMKLLVKVMEDEPPAPHRLAPEVPRDLEAVCLKCLRKEPHARYASAEELAADLARFLSGEAVEARATGVFGKVVGALDRSGKDVEFAAYSSCLFWVAGLMLGGEVLVLLTVLHAFNPWLIPVAQWCRVLAFVGVVWWHRGGRLLPATGTERLLWSLGGGYILSCFACAISMRFGQLGLEPEKDIFLYQPLAALTGLLFFSLGSVLWGWCYVFGLSFLAVAFLMAADLRFSPLLFGATWAAVLTVIGLRLRRLARESATVTRTS